MDEVLLNFFNEISVVFVVVFQNLSVFEQGDAGTDIQGVGEVVAGNDDGGSCFAVVTLEQVLHGVLAGGVEEVEGFVEQQQPGIVEHGSDDAYLLLVSGGEVADEGVGAEHFAIHEVFKFLQTRGNGVFADVVDFTDEIEVFFGGKVLDEEAGVYIRTGLLFPLFAVCRSHASYACHAAVGLNEVEYNAEKRRLACPVVAYQSDDFTVVYGIVLDVEGNFLAKGFLYVIDCQFHNL